MCDALGTDAYLLTLTGKGKTMKTRRDEVFNAVRRGIDSVPKTGEAVVLITAITGEIMQLPLDIEEELIHLYNICTDKQGKLDILVQLHEFRFSKKNN